VCQCIILNKFVNTHLLDSLQEDDINSYFGLFISACTGEDWADSCCAFAFAKEYNLIYNQRVRIYQYDDAKKKLMQVFDSDFEEIKHTMTTYMLYNGSDHYDALMQMISEPGGSETKNVAQKPKQSVLGKTQQETSDGPEGQARI
jgi:hypothetical protein